MISPKMLRKMEKAKRNFEIVLKCFLKTSEWLIDFENVLENEKSSQIGMTLFEGLKLKIVVFKN